MYPRRTDGLDRGAETEKENASPECDREDKPKPKQKSKPDTLRRALRATNTAVIGDTLDLCSAPFIDFGCHR
jgi:hypothetical protein